MQIMTQDRKRLINGDFVRLIYIDDTSKRAKLMVTVDKDDILLGVYDKSEQAELALSFIAICLIDEMAPHKITQVPSQSDITTIYSRFPDGINSDGVRKLLEHAMTAKRRPKKVQ